MQRTNTDHSCVGRNLFNELENYRRYLQTIPAKAGISMATALRRQWRRQQCQISHNSPFPSQDHSCVGRNLTVMCCQQCQNPPTHSRSPTDHSCESRNLQGDSPLATMRRAAIMQHSPTIPRPHNIHSCGSRNLTVICRQ